MNNLLSKIFEQKKLLFLFFVFFILTGFMVPCIAHGSFSSTSWWEYTIPGWNSYVLGKNIFGGITDTAITNITNGFIIAVGGISMAVTGALASLAQGLLSGIMSLPACIGGVADTNTASATYGQPLPGCVGGYTFGSSYTHITGSDANVAVAAGWPMVRDLANMFIVLGFIIVGIATALRFRDYEAKKLLAPLIIVALLVNFSLLICGIFIDGSNIVTTYFITGGGSFGQNFIKSILTEGSIYAQAFGNSPANPIAVFGMVTGFVFYNIIAIIIYFLYFFLFIFRYMALWILVILSPLAFVCYVFPFTKKFWNMWRDNFFQWCIIGIPASFFLWLADKILSQSITNSSNVSNIQFATYLVPGLMLIVGFMFALKTSAIGAGMVISAFKKGGNAVGGAALQLSGRTQAGQRSQEWLKSTGNRIAEATGFAPQGHTAQQKASRAAEAKKGIDAMRDSSNSGDQGRFEQLVKSGRGPVGAAAIASASEKGSLAKIMGGNLGAAKARISYATPFGYKKSDLLKSDPNLADSRQGITEATAKVSPAKAAEWNPSVVTPEVFNSLSANHIKAIGKMGSPELVNKIKAYQYVPGEDSTKQSPEWKAAANDIIKNAPSGSPQRAKANAEYLKRMRHIATDENYS